MRTKPPFIKMIAFVLLACVLSVFLLSNIFTITHANHTHDHAGIDGGCAVCCFIHNLEKLLRLLTSLFASTSFALFAIMLGVIAVTSFALHLPCTTPVSFKVRMNN
jgi:hypothetical protein